MGMRMLIDATHPEETRVVVVKGTRLEEFDYETSTKQVNKGNIYLARVTRVEPSLQAAFVEYGGNRHGFLAFSEIHPDYYQIPIADRQALLAQQAEEEAAAAAEEEAELAAEEARAAARAAAELAAGDAAAEHDGQDEAGVEIVDGDYDTVEDITASSDAEPAAAPAPTVEAQAAEVASTEAPAEMPEAAPAAEQPAATAEQEEASSVPAYWNVPHVATPAPSISAPVDETEAHAEDAHAHAHADEVHADEVQGEENGKGDKHDDGDESRARRRRTNVFRRYKIQEVIKRRQIMLVQVVKEERGNKGAALTTYLSLAGRYCVLMPNTARGGGISRKIQSQADRKRLKAITAELDIQDGMGVIVRTAGMERSKPEIKRDFEYLLRSWDSIRERTLESSAPALIYEEAGLIKRSIRDLYSDQIDEVIVEGEEGYRFAHDFMQMLMPNHADNVKQYSDKIPLFTRYQVEQQLDAMFSPTVQLKSGGYIVINPTEALVSIDVNSGKSTREHNIEETAYKTNLEAAEEVARQLRLRDLAGLVVIDFIDMEENRNIRKVEQKLKECLRNDRARIQVGRISGFGLLEMSRQRLRPSLLESSTMPCPHCQGRGYVRSIESTALTVLRAIEEEGIRDRSAEITVAMSAEVALYLLNHKRDRIGDMERRYVMRVILAADPSLVPPDFRIERSKTRQPGEISRPEVVSRLDRPITQESAYASDAEDGDAEETETESTAEAGNAASEDGGENGDSRRRRRRRRRRGGRGREDGGREDGREDNMSAEGAEDETADAVEGDAGDVADDAEESGEQGAEAGAEGAADGEGQDGDGRRRRRGRRGGRRRRGREDGSEGGERQPRGERAPREDRPRRDVPDYGVTDSPMTPASIGAMLDGVPEFDFGDDLPPLPAKPTTPAQSAPAPQAIEHAPEALKPAEEPPVSVPEAVVATPVEPVAPPPVPVQTGPVFETTVIAPDGSTDKPAEPVPAKKGWWRR